MHRREGRRQKREKKERHLRETQRQQTQAEEKPKDPRRPALRRKATSGAAAAGAPAAAKAAAQQAAPGPQLARTQSHPWGRPEAWAAAAKGPPSPPLTSEGEQRRHRKHRCHRGERPWSAQHAPTERAQRGSPAAKPPVERRQGRQRPIPQRSAARWEEAPEEHRPLRRRSQARRSWQGMQASEHRAHRHPHPSARTQASHAARPRE